MIVLKAPEEIEIMRAANVIVAEVLAELRAAVRPGVTTADLDRIAEELTRKRGAVPAFKGYSVAGRVYPAALCASINAIARWIPSPAGAPSISPLLTITPSCALAASQVVGSVASSPSGRMT